jgi:hypothetical protein
MKRMWPFLILLLISLSWTPQQVSATRVEIPLPQLSGAYVTACYDCGVSRQETFRFDRIPISVHGVSIKLRGLSVPGEYYCDWVTPTSPWHIEFLATLSDSVTGGVWRADSIIAADYISRDASEFEIEIRFQPQNAATWESLEVGRGTLVLLGKPEWMPRSLACGAYSFPAATLYLVALAVDADFQIGVQQSTWGSIKALFVE